MTRRAAALPAVLYMITLVGAMVVGSVFLARAATASVRLEQSSLDADWPAEVALTDLLASWDSTVRAAQPIGSTTLEISQPDVSVAVTRLGPLTFRCVARYQRRIRPALRRQLSVLVSAAGVSAQPAPERAWTLLP